MKAGAGSTGLLTRCPVLGSLIPWVLLMVQAGRALGDALSGAPYLRQLLI